MTAKALYDTNASTPRILANAAAELEFDSVEMAAK